jgi:hypothetical protein
MESIELVYRDPYGEKQKREIHGNKYKNQLRRKIEDAVQQYRALGGTRISILAREALPVVKRDLKIARDLLVATKEKIESGETIDLVKYEANVKVLKERLTGIRAILSPPKRTVHTAHQYYRETPSRVLDFDSSDHAAQQYGGTVFSGKFRTDVPRGDADLDHNFNPKREAVRSDVTDEVTILQARLQWYRDRIKACNTVDSVEQWLLSS